MDKQLTQSETWQQQLLTYFNIAVGVLTALILFYGLSNYLIG
jgi:hypothetical protein